MDVSSQALEQQLHNLKKQQIEAENTLEKLKRDQNDQAWLEEDFARVCHEERESIEFLREVWQSPNATSFGYYLEDLHEQEKTSWRKNFQAKNERLQTQTNRCQNTIYQLEDKQQSIQKELVR
ncbi:DNA double-strand break repair Rad50 ATPase [Listeria seeligeri]|uniref:DNA double-strand break repair Rad50 ATPase n=2 Tax=Listeria seeligeri TaxID=1640 RepID=A0ABR5E9M9_LISSE|nr:hypothetical protein [Listeria seeligeri]KKD47046.1 DNA double-strand break repair Rad50 ATPase [Listeria seeligeri]MBC1593055.1 DNA double-strand break repair Rad50 ATPase [Listeria seeligeri]MBC1915616.1 DNA double-strand break repair Rad50 ATPase [Listeria seeligeri]MBC1988929.1 DNA double-strand break repair Rad50 ATPase [Listeria seeligeri]MBC2070640.1 DNA double-strand break repair Rad50 ATPase [Listeria seeligeri]